MFGSSSNYWLLFISHISAEEPGNFDSVIINDAYVDLKNRIHKVRDLP